MGKRGPKNKPTKLKLIEGNPGHRPINKREPQPNNSKPKCPSHIMEDKEARLEWHRAIRLLYDIGLVTQVDRAALACYCQAYSRWIEAERNIREFGLIVSSPKGYPMQSPFLAIANKAMEQMKSFLTEFGMTPSSRSGLKIQEESPVDALKNLIRD
jgi:P27 family predicted phage terminase small subunit